MESQQNLARRRNARVSVLMLNVIRRFVYLAKRSGSCLQFIPATERCDLLYAGVSIDCYNLRLRSKFWSDHKSNLCRNVGIQKARFKVWNVS